MNKQLLSFIIIIVCSGVLYYHFKYPSTSVPAPEPAIVQDTLKADPATVTDTTVILLPNTPMIQDTLPGQIATGNVHPQVVVAFAESLMGVQYKYASTDPAVGFDCSGFITYVFNHFGIKVPRSSVDFTNVGTEVAVPEAMRGDIILFTGTDSTERYVGHMGIIVSNENGELKFIHSSSGKANGVTVSPLKGYYTGRFVKVIRIWNNGPL